MNIAQTNCPGQQGPPMTISRHNQVKPEEPGWYHTVSGCVRRARLCGFTRRPASPSSTASSGFRRGSPTSNRCPLISPPTASWTGRSVREGKPGAIPNDLAPMLERLEIDTDQWCREMTGLKHRLGTAIGRAAELAAEAARRGTQRVVSALKVPIEAKPATV